MIEPDDRGDGQAVMEPPRLRTQYKAHIRWMVRCDIPEVLGIDGLSFGEAWAEDHLLSVLRNLNVIGMVAERGGRIVGFAVYKLGAEAPRRRKHVELLRLAVHPGRRCRGVGRQMVAKLMGKLHEGRRRLEIPVPECNLAAQRWLRAIGVRAVGVLRDYYEAGDGVPAEDAYLFRARWDGEGDGR